MAPPGRSPFLRTSPALTAFLRLQDRRTSSRLGDFCQAWPIVPQRSKQSVHSLPRLWPSACWTAGCPPWWDVERPTGCPSDCLAAGSPAGSKKGRERRGSPHAPPLSRRALSAPCPPPPSQGRPERSGGAAAGRQRPLAASCRWRPPGLFLCPHPSPARPGTEESSNQRLDKTLEAPARWTRAPFGVLNPAFAKKGGTPPSGKGGQRDRARTLKGRRQGSPSTSQLDPGAVARKAALA